MGHHRGQALDVGDAAVPASMTVPISIAPGVRLRARDVVLMAPWMSSAELSALPWLFVFLPLLGLGGSGLFGRLVRQFGLGRRQPRGQRSVDHLVADAGGHRILPARIDVQLDREQGGCSAGQRIGEPVAFKASLGSVAALTCATISPRQATPPAGQSLPAAGSRHVRPRSRSTVCAKQRWQSSWRRYPGSSVPVGPAWAAARSR